MAIYNGIQDLPKLQQELMKKWDIQWASQASLLLNDYSKDTLIPDTIGSVYSNYYNNLFQPSNSAYAQILGSVDADYKNKIWWLLNEANSSYWPNGVLRKQTEDFYNQQALALANRLWGQQALNAALASKQWLDPNQVNIGANQLASQAADERLKLQQWQLSAFDNLTKTMLDFTNRYNDQYANSTDKYVVQTAQQLKQIRDALVNTALNQELQKDMMKYQKSLSGWWGWSSSWTGWITEEQLRKLWLWNTEDKYWVQTWANNNQWFFTTPDKWKLVENTLVRAPFLVMEEAKRIASNPNNKLLSAKTK